MSEPAHHPSGPLGLAVALAAAAGFIDAHIYVHVTPVFVANMSGNMIHLGILVGDGAWRPAIASLLTLMAFTGGVVAGTIHLDRLVARCRPIRPTSLLFAEAALLLSLTGYVAAASVSFSAEPQPNDYPVLLIAGVAMGLQAAALRRVGQIAIATTYGTGAIVRVGEKIVLAARRAERTTEHRRRVAIAVLVSVLASYIVGAVAATAAGGGAGKLLAPGLVVIACAVASNRSPAGEPNADRGTGEAPVSP